LSYAVHVPVPLSLPLLYSQPSFSFLSHQTSLCQPPSSSVRVVCLEIVLPRSCSVEHTASSWPKKVGAVQYSSSMPWKTRSRFRSPSWTLFIKARQLSAGLPIPCLRVKFGYESHHCNWTEDNYAGLEDAAASLGHCFQFGRPALLFTRTRLCTIFSSPSVAAARSRDIVGRLGSCYMYAG